MHTLIKLVLAGIWMVLIPAFAGVTWVRKKKDYTLGECFLAGIMFMFALAEILILPAIYRKMSLHFVTVVFAVIMSVFAGICLDVDCCGSDLYTDFYCGCVCAYGCG